MQSLGTSRTRLQGLTAELAPRPKWARRSVLRRHAKLVMGLAIILIMVGVAVFAPVLAPHDPNRSSLRTRLMPPAWEDEGDPAYLLGTDQLGRDLLSRIIFGARVSLFVGFVSVCAAGTLGTGLGLVAGYYAGSSDSIIMGITDVMMALPFILIALLVVALLGPSLVNVVITFTLTAWYVEARIVRAAVLSLREAEYVQAARALGAGALHIIWRHILPNLLNSLLVVLSFEVARIITTEAALSFLGLGVPPPDASWGSILSDGREYIQDAWWISTFPGVALMIIVLGINIFGDALRDILDPKVKSRT